MFFKYKEHNLPHFHAVYGEYNGSIDINTLEMIEGDLPSKALELIKEWAKEYQFDLLRIWNNQEFEKLPPLV